MDNKIIVLIPLGFILISLIFFSRGILIFFTLLCLAMTSFPFLGIDKITIQFRWVFVFLFCFYAFGDILLGRTVRRIKPFDISAIVFIIYAFLSALYSLFPSLTLERAMTILMLYISVFWITWKYAYDRGPERVAYLILQVMWVAFIASYLMIFFATERCFLFGRFTGIFVNPNGMGIVGAIILPLSLWHILETKKKSAFLLFFMILLGMLHSGGRGALNAVAVALGYFIYARSKKYRLLVFFSSLSFILLFIWIIQTLAKEFFRVYIRAETLPSWGGRLELWPIALNLIMDKPFFGYGFGVEDKIIQLKKIFLLKHAGTYFHNSYLGILFQSGIVGFILFFGPLFILLFKELSTRQINSTPLLRYALRASLISGLICCINESWIYSVGNGISFPFWIMVMLLAFYRHCDKEKNSA